MTRFLMLVLCASLALALPGCSGDTTPTTSEDDSPTKPDTTTPETTTPDETTPDEGTEPEAPMPMLPDSEPAEPEITEPEITVPEVAEPAIDGTSAVEVPMPEPTVPETTTPELAAPELNPPALTEPEAPVVEQPIVEEPAVPEVAVAPLEEKIAARVADAPVQFAVASATDSDPAVAAKKAAEDALAQLGGEAKGLIFYEYFPKTIKTTDAEGNETDKEVPDTDKEKAVLPAIREVAADIPTIGCRARSLVTGGTMLTDTVAVLAIGGTDVTCQTVKVELDDNRLAVGTAIGEALKDVADLKLIMALSEMRLSFETKEGVSVEDFIRGVSDTAGKDVTLFGGNCLPNDYETDKGGVQYINDETLAGHVVAMGIGGPIAVHANHTNEFTPSEQTATVTKSQDKWIIELDGQPAADVYRKLRGMTDDEAFTSDWQHPIGVIVAPEKVYLRMVLDWIDADGKNSKGETSDLPPGSLSFVAAVPEGTKIKVLAGGDDAQAIVAAAKEGIGQSLAQAGDAKPLLALLSDCCARGMRLREFRTGDECEIELAVRPIVEEAGGFPIFGFYAWGELGPIAGDFGGLGCMYQQHTFVSAVLTEEQK